MDWPVKTRELHNHHMDSTHWDDFPFRDDDIIVGTWGKAGTTWTQQIVLQLIHGGDPDISMHDVSPWLDVRVIPKEAKFEALAAQKHRRCIKTHLPADALVFHPPAKYLYVTRDMPDIVWSMHNHLYHAVDEFYDMFNNTPGLVGEPLQRPPADIRRFWQDFLDGDGYPCWSFRENIRSWWDLRQLPNVKLLHFNDLKNDMEGEIRDIAAFLGIDINPSDWPRIIEYCSFTWMKANADKVAPGGGQLWESGGTRFINQGENRRWKDVLSDSDIAVYRAKATAELGEECAHWMFSGRQGLTST